MQLIERLKAFGEKSEIYFGCDEDDEIWQDCGKYVLDNLPAIIAALQFAEDVDFVTETEGTSLEFIHKNPDFNGLPDCLVILRTNFGFTEERFPGENIFKCATAARSAVAALTKGEA